MDGWTECGTKQWCAEDETLHMTPCPWMGKREECEVLCVCVYLLICIPLCVARLAGLGIPYEVMYVCIPQQSRWWTVETRPSEGQRNECHFFWVVEATDHCSQEEEIERWGDRRDPWETHSLTYSWKQARGETGPDENPLALVWIVSSWAYIGRWINR